MKVSQNKMINMTYFYLQMLISFLLTNLFLVAYLFFLSMTPTSQLSLVILFIVTWPITPYILTFFQIMRKRELKEHNEFETITVALFLKKFIKNLKNNFLWLVITHLALFVLAVDVLILPKLLKLIFSLMLFVASSLCLLGNYILSQEQRSVKETIKMAIEIFYSKFIRHFSHLFCYVSLFILVLLYSGFLLSLVGYFIFLTVIFNYFTKQAPLAR